MPGEWKVTPNTVNGRFAIYRENGGKIEMQDFGYIFANQETAQRFADDLNYERKNHARRKK